MHTGQISYTGAKMSKSLGNLIMISNLSKKYSSNAIRFLLLSHSFQEDWEFFEQDLEAANKKNEEIEIAFKSNLKSNPAILKKFEMLMDNNLDTSKVLDLAYENREFVQAKEILKILGFAY